MAKDLVAPALQSNKKKRDLSILGGRVRERHGEVKTTYCADPIDVKKIGLIYHNEQWTELQ